MQKLIESALGRSRTVTVVILSVLVLSLLCVVRIPVDILPIFNSPAVQVLTYYSGMPAENVAHGITNPMERMTGQAAGMKRQESRSILGASIVRNYFREEVDPNGALTQVNSLALGEIPNLPPGTLPPVVLPYDPTSTVPVCLVAVDSREYGESTLYDVGRFEVRNFIMNSPGTNAPVVFGGKIRAVVAEVDPIKLESRNLSLRDVLQQLAEYNLFLPTGDAKFGRLDYAIGSNAMYDKPHQMEGIPLRTSLTDQSFLGDVATVRDSHLIQMCKVRVNGRPEVYIPVFRQAGASTLDVVNHLKKALPEIEPRLTKPNIKLKMVMDQSVYVRQSIRSLITEGVLGAVLCSLVILLFLGQWRMTAIALMTIPIAIMAGIVGLYYTGNTVNVMTLAGLALAIGPLVDSAIVCLENTHRHLQAGESTHDAALHGASEVAKPGLVATLCTLLVLAPLALMPGMGQYLFRPMALAVAFTMATAYLLSNSFVPSRAFLWLKPHERQPPESPPGATSEQPEHDQADEKQEASDEPASSPQDKHKSWLQRGFDKISAGIDAGIRWYTRQLDRAMNHRWTLVLGAAGFLAVVIVGLVPIMRREFFPEVDAGAIEMYVRLNTGTRLEETETKIAEVEDFVRRTVGDDLELIISQLGVWSDWSCAYTPNSGPMDAVLEIQLKSDRQRSSQHYVTVIRQAMARDNRFAAIEIAFNTGGTIRSAMNEGGTTPIDIRIEGKNLEKSHEIAEHVLAKISLVDGVEDARIVQRLDYPEYIVDVDRAKSRRLGLTEREIMENVVAALKSSIQFNKKNFWFDPISHNQYYVGVQYPERDITSVQTLLNVSITSSLQKQPIPLSDLVKLRSSTMAAEVAHRNLMTTIDVTMNVEGRDLGHVSDDIIQLLNGFGKSQGSATWQPYDPSSSDKKLVEGSRIELSGEYRHMQDTFFNFSIGLPLAIVFVYFLMVMLLDSYLIPLVVLSAVPVGLIGVILMLWVTGTAINVQSLLGMIFMAGIVVSNTVLLIDFAQNIRSQEGLDPTAAIRKAAGIRARPVVMTAVAALLAVVPMALALERGSEANAPLGRAVIGGLVAGLVTTLFVVPALYSLMVREPKKPAQA